VGEEGGVGERKREKKMTLSRITGARPDFSLMRNDGKNS
jgi:hypothetical protein